MTKAQIRASVRRMLDDQTSTFYTDSDINDAIDEAWEDLADGAEWYEETANLTALAGRTYYRLDEILPESFISPRAIYNTISNMWLVPESARGLDNALRQWELSEGDPRHVMMFGSWIMGVYPKSSDERFLRVNYVGIPDALEDDEEPPFDIEFQDALTNGALYVLYAQQRETDKALRYFKKYDKTESDFRTWVQARQQQDRVSGLK